MVICDLLGTYISTSVVQFCDVAYCLQFLFVSNFLLFLCSKLSWLHISFWVQLNVFVLYCIISILKDHLQSVL